MEIDSHSKADMGAEMTAAAPAVATPTLDEIRQWPATVDVTSAARAMGISRAQMYRLIAEGKAPVRVLDFGAKRVVTASLVRLLEAA